MSRESSPFDCGTPKLYADMCDVAAEMEATMQQPQNSGGHVLISRLDLNRWIHAIRFQRQQWDKIVRNYLNEQTQKQRTDSKVPDLDPGTSDASS